MITKEEIETLLNRSIPDYYIVIHPNWIKKDFIFHEELQELVNKGLALVSEKIREDK